jgi:hypothetical protein
LSSRWQELLFPELGKISTSLVLEGDFWSAGERLDLLLSPRT